MKNKIITTIVSIVLIIIPVLIIPNSENNYNLLKIIMLLLCGVALFVMLVIKRKQLKFDINDIFIFIFGIMAIISTIFSLNVKKSIIGESNRYEGLLTIITYILIYYSSKYHFKNNKKITKIVMGVYMAICLVAIIQEFSHSFSPFGPIIVILSEFLKSPLFLTGGFNPR